MEVCLKINAQSVGVGSLGEMCGRHLNNIAIKTSMKSTSVRIANNFSETGIRLSIKGKKPSNILVKAFLIEVMLWREVKGFRKTVSNDSVFRQLQ